MTRALVCAGGAVLDLVAQGGDLWRSRPGGSALNVARVTARLGTPTALLAAVSTDAHGEAILNRAREDGVGLDLVWRAEAPTALSLVQSGHYQFWWRGGADASLEYERLDWSGVGAAYFGGATLLRDPASEALLRHAHDAHAAGVPIAYDPNYRPQYAATARESFLAYLPLASVLKVSDEDLAGLLPGLGIEEALGVVRERSPGVTILLTRGAEGAELHAPDGSARHPGFPVNVVDTVGAGDASLGGLLHHYLTVPNATADERLAFALACGAIACTRAGAYAPTFDEVRGLLDSAR